ncbi:MAG: hypothetical protein GX638_18025, partial [Crenarchaeota archaeon]|nr:hypothetical protein [Thermoproteota archaeon]
MRKIHKYKIVPGMNKIQIENCEKILSVGYQKGSIFLFALVDQNYVHTFHYDVLVIGADWTVIENLIDYKFLGSVTDHDSHLIYHVFYKV